MMDRTLTSNSAMSNIVHQQLHNSLLSQHLPPLYSHSLHIQFHRVTSIEEKKDDEGDDEEQEVERLDEKAEEADETEHTMEADSIRQRSA